MKNFPILISSATRGPGEHDFRKKKMNAWIHLSEMFNSRDEGGEKRSPDKLQKLWNNLKQDAKKHETKRVREQRKTGGGPADISSDSGIDAVYAKVKSLIPGEIDSITSNFDDDAIVIPEQCPSMSQADNAHNQGGTYNSSLVQSDDLQPSTSGHQTYPQLGQPGTYNLSLLQADPQPSASGSQAHAQLGSCDLQPQLETDSQPTMSPILISDTSGSSTYDMATGDQSIVLYSIPSTPQEIPKKQSGRKRRPDLDDLKAQVLQAKLDESLAKRKLLEKDMEVKELETRMRQVEHTLRVAYYSQKEASP